MKNEFKVISVESRKGGVGKTTAALNLSTVLIKQGYEVLLLDIDITGTSISGSYKSSYWKNHIFPVKRNNKDINLLEIFSKTFINGNNICDFSMDVDIKDKYIVSKGRINIISSEIFLSEARKEKHSKLMFDPRILFDELHSFWLIDMLKQLCEKFTKFMKSEKVVVVLDNSPGYIGLGKSVHSWLTDIGPQNGKFLTVSSFDTQDLNSCLSAIQEIDEIVDIKIQGSKYYNDLKEGVTTKSPNVKGVENFFLKLATTENDKLYQYYRSNYHNDKPSIESYQSLIINKVPHEFLSRNFYYDYNDAIDNNKDRNEIYKAFSQNQVFFENDIHTQFIQPFVRKQKQYERRYDSNLKGYFTRLENNSINNQNDLTEIDILKEITRYQNQLNNLLSKMSLHGFNNITDLVEKRWFPETPFLELQQAFELSLISLEPHFYDEFYFGRDENEEISYRNLDIVNVVDDKLHNIIEENNLFRFNMGITNEFYVRALLRYMVSPFNLRTINIEFILDYIIGIIGVILEIQTERIKHGPDSKREHSLSYFLANENLTYKDIRYSMKNILHRYKKYEHKLERSIRYEETNPLVDLYNCFCHAQARLIDLNYDFRFLVIVLREVSINSSNESILYPNMKDILDRVLITKQIPHSMAENELNKSLYDVKEMTIFQDVITGIIKKWRFNEV